MRAPNYSPETRNVAFTSFPIAGVVPPCSPTSCTPLLPSQRRCRAIFLRLDVRCVCRHIDGRFGFPVPSFTFAFAATSTDDFPYAVVSSAGMGLVHCCDSGRIAVLYSTRTLLGIFWTAWPTGIHAVTHRRPAAVYLPCAARHGFHFEGIGTATTCLAY